MPTRYFTQWGERFNKARGINYGLANLRRDGWVLHIDADIALPPRTRWLLGATCLEDTKIYGCDRVDIVGRSAWNTYKADPLPQYLHSCRMEPPTQFPLGSRLMHLRYGGYCPIGYFQLWNPRASEIHDYPDTCDGSAERTDVLHSLQWGREDRVLIPEIIALHLLTKTTMGANWRGRTTPEFSLAEKPYQMQASAPRRTY